MGKAGGSKPPRPETAAAIREASRSATQPQPTRPTQRKYTAEFKQRVLRELDALAASGEWGAQGAFLRREGLPRATVKRWRHERDEAGVAALAPKKPGRKPSRDPVAEENERLRRELERVQKELRKAEIIIDVQKKLSALLGVELPPVPEESEKKP